VLVPEAPEQQTVKNRKSWSKNGYAITPLAQFNLRARVLHRKLYSDGRQADLSPIDLALGWGRMSDQQVVDQFTVTQHSRWYFWRSQSLPIPQVEVVASSSNMHMIPSTDDVEYALKLIREGDVIKISGYLVAVNAADGWKWRSSLTRKDTGNGSCEIVWVEKVDTQPTSE
jgi:hypothetical protein